MSGEPLGTGGGTVEHYIGEIFGSIFGHKHHHHHDTPPPGPPPGPPPAPTLGVNPEAGDWTGGSVGGHDGDGSWQPTNPVGVTSSDGVRHGGSYAFNDNGVSLLSERIQGLTVRLRQLCGEVTATGVNSVHLGAFPDADNLTDHFASVGSTFAGNLNRAADSLALIRRVLEEQRVQYKVTELKNITLSDSVLQSIQYSGGQVGGVQTQGFGQ